MPRSRYANAGGKRPNKAVSAPAAGQKNMPLPNGVIPARYQGEMQNPHLIISDALSAKVKRELWNQVREKSPDLMNFLMALGNTGRKMTGTSVRVRFK